MDEEQRRRRAIEDSVVEGLGGTTVRCRVEPDQVAVVGI